MALQDISARTSDTTVGQRISAPMPRPATDDELLARIGMEDAEAFRLLVERHVDRAYAVAYRILRNEADAEDVIQDCFLKVWSLGARWEAGRATFATWLYRVVANRCIDMKRRPAASDIDTAPEQACDEPDPSDSLLRAEAARLLAGAMSDLPGQQKTALTLSYFESKSNADIASIMQVSVMAVESLLKRARQHLRSTLAREGADMLKIFQNS